MLLTRNSGVAYLRTPSTSTLVVFASRGFMASWSPRDLITSLSFLYGRVASCQSFST